MSATEATTPEELLQRNEHDVSLPLPHDSSSFTVSTPAYSPEVQNPTATSHLEISLNCLIPESENLHENQDEQDFKVVSDKPLDSGMEEVDESETALREEVKDANHSDETVRKMYEDEVERTEIQEVLQNDFSSENVIDDATENSSFTSGDLGQTENSNTYQFQVMVQSPDESVTKVEVSTPDDKQPEQHFVTQENEEGDISDSKGGGVSPQSPTSLGTPPFESQLQDNTVSTDKQTHAVTESRGNRRKMGSTRRNKGRQHDKEFKDEDVIGDETPETTQMSATEATRPEELLQGNEHDVSLSLPQDTSMFKVSTPAYSPDIQSPPAKSYSEISLDSLISESENLKEDKNQTTFNVISDKPLDSVMEEVVKSETALTEEVKDPHHPDGNQAKQHFVTEEIKGGDVPDTKDSGVPLQTQLLLATAPFESQLQDNTLSTDKQSHAVTESRGNRRKMGSTRRIKGRQRDKEVKDEDAIGDETPETTEMSATEATTPEELLQRNEHDVSLPLPHDSSSFTVSIPAYSPEVQNPTATSHLEISLNCLIPESENLHENQDEQDFKVVSDKPLDSGMEEVDESETALREEVKDANHSDETVRKMYEDEVERTEIQEVLQNDFSSENVIDDATENSSFTSGDLGQTENSNTYQFQVMVQSPDESVTKVEVSTPDDKQPEQHFVTQENEEGDISDSKGGGVSPQSPTSLGTPPFESQLQDNTVSTDKQTHAVTESRGNRRKMGSTRRNKGRQHDKEFKDEDVIGDETPETTQMSATEATRPEELLQGNEHDVSLSLPQDTSMFKVSTPAYSPDIQSPPAKSYSEISLDSLISESENLKEDKNQTTFNVISDKPLDSVMEEVVKSETALTEEVKDPHHPDGNQAKQHFVTEEIKGGDVPDTKDSGVPLQTQLLLATAPFESQLQDNTLSTDKQSHAVTESRGNRRKMGSTRRIKGRQRDKEVKDEDAIGDETPETTEMSATEATTPEELLQRNEHDVSLPLPHDSSSFTVSIPAYSPEVQNPTATSHLEISLNCLIPESENLHENQDEQDFKVVSDKPLDSGMEEVDESETALREEVKDANHSDETVRKMYEDEVERTEIQEVLQNDFSSENVIDDATENSSFTSGDLGQTENSNTYQFQVMVQSPDESVTKVEVSTPDDKQPEQHFVTQENEEGDISDSKGGGVSPQSPTSLGTPPFESQLQDNTVSTDKQTHAVTESRGNRRKMGSTRRNKGRQHDKEFKDEDVIGDETPETTQMSATEATRPEELLQGNEHDVSLSLPQDTSMFKVSTPAYSPDIQSPPAKSYSEISLDSLISESENLKEDKNQTTFNVISDKPLDSVMEEVVKSETALTEEVKDPHHPDGNQAKQHFVTEEIKGGDVPDTKDSGVPLQTQLLLATAPFESQLQDNTLSTDKQSHAVTESRGNRRKMGSTRRIKGRQRDKEFKDEDAIGDETPETTEMSATEATTPEELLQRNEHDVSLPLPHDSSSFTVSIPAYSPEVQNPTATSHLEISLNCLIPERENLHENQDEQDFKVVSDKPLDSGMEEVDESETALREEVKDANHSDETVRKMYEDEVERTEIQEVLQNDFSSENVIDDATENSSFTSGDLGQTENSNTYQFQVMVQSPDESVTKVEVSMPDDKQPEQHFVTQENEEGDISDSKGGGVSPQSPTSLGTPPFESQLQDNTVSTDKQTHAVTESRGNRRKMGSTRRNKGRQHDKEFKDEDVIGDETPETTQMSATEATRPEELLQGNEHDVFLSLPQDTSMFKVSTPAYSPDIQSPPATSYSEISLDSLISESENLKEDKNQTTFNVISDKPLESVMEEVIKSETALTEEVKDPHHPDGNQAKQHFVTEEIKGGDVPDTKDSGVPLQTQLLLATAPFESQLQDNTLSTDKQSHAVTESRGNRRKMGSTRRIKGRQRDKEFKDEDAIGDETPETTEMSATEATTPEELLQRNEHDVSLPLPHDSSSFTVSIPAYSPEVQNPTATSHLEISLNCLIPERENLHENQDEQDFKVVSDKPLDSGMEEVDESETALREEVKDANHSDETVRKMYEDEVERTEIQEVLQNDFSSENVIDDATENSSFTSGDLGQTENSNTYQFQVMVQSPDESVTKVEVSMPDDKQPEQHFVTQENEEGDISDSKGGGVSPQSPTSLGTPPFESQLQDNTVSTDKQTHAVTESRGNRRKMGSTRRNKGRQHDKEFKDEDVIGDETPETTQMSATEATRPEELLQGNEHDVSLSLPQDTSMFKVSTPAYSPDIQSPPATSYSEISLDSLISESENLKEDKNQTTFNVISDKPLESVMEEVIKSETALTEEVKDPHHPDGNQAKQHFVTQEVKGGDVPDTKDSGVPLQTQLSLATAPFESQLQDNTLSTDKQSHAVTESRGNRRKMGSTRRIKGRQRDKEFKDEDAIGDETPETTEMSATEATTPEELLQRNEHDVSLPLPHDSSSFTVSIPAYSPEVQNPTATSHLEISLNCLIPESENLHENQDEQDFKVVSDKPLDSGMEEVDESETALTEEVKDPHHPDGNQAKQHFVTQEIKGGDVPDTKDSGVPLQTQLLLATAPFESQLQDNTLSTDKQSHAVTESRGNRRKMGSTRRIKGRQRDKEFKDEDAIGDETPETTEMSATEATTPEELLQENKHDLSLSVPYRENSLKNQNDGDPKVIYDKPVQAGMEEVKKDQHIKLLGQDGSLASNILLSGTTECTITVEKTTDQSSPRESTEVQCSVAQETFLASQNVLTRNREQHEHCNPTEVTKANQSESSSMHQTDYSSSTESHQTPLSETNISLDNSQDITEIHTGLSRTGNRKKMGSSRRNKGRQCVKDPDAYQEPKDDILEKPTSNDKLRTVEMSPATDITKEEEEKDLISMDKEVQITSTAKEGKNKEKLLEEDAFFSQNNMDSNTDGLLKSNKDFNEENKVVQDAMNLDQLTGCDTITKHLMQSPQASVCEVPSDMQHISYHAGIEGSSSLKVLDKEEALEAMDASNGQQEQTQSGNRNTLQINPKQKKRKIGSTRRSQLNRKKEEETDNTDETKESDFHTEADVRNIDKMDVGELLLTTDIPQNETAQPLFSAVHKQQEADETFSVPSSTEINVIPVVEDFKAPLPEQSSSLREETIGLVTCVITGGVREVIVEPPQLDNFTNTETQITTVVTGRSRRSINQLLPPNTEAATDTGIAEESLVSSGEARQNTHSDEERPESIKVVQDQDASEKNPSNLNELAHNKTQEMRSESPNLHLSNRRRKMGSTRRNLGSRNKEELHQKQEVDNEAKETGTDIGETESVSRIKEEALQLHTDHKNNDGDQGKQKVFETVEISPPGQSKFKPLPEQTVEERPASQDQLAETEHHTANDLLSTSLKDDLVSESASGGRRRKLGSNRKSRGHQRIEDQTGEGTIIDDQSGTDARISEVGKRDKKPSSGPSKSEEHSKTVSEKTSAQPCNAGIFPSKENQTFSLVDNPGVVDSKSKRYNVVMIGDSSVGKTSFMKRAQSGKFSLDIPASIGLDSLMWPVVVDGKPMILQLWDTAGQERFHSITKQVFHRAQAFLLMYDITSTNSFSAVSYWANCIQESAAENVTVLLLGNKSDCSERRVKTHQGEILAKEYDFEFMECSAATGENVIQSLEVVARKLSQRIDSREEATVLHKEPEQKKSSRCC
ncbi:titin-like [Pelmatolapia mariae]|uniref:titin-like n=1 Tax=Pelmatolapia mariae TaxID=158779 RepID=UPI002FE5716D